MDLSLKSRSVYTSIPTVPWWTSQRFLLAIICFFGFVVLYAQRVNLSIAIVSMVERKLETAHPDNGSSLSNYGSTVSPPSDDLCPEMEKRALVSSGVLVYAGGFW